MLTASVACLRELRVLKFKAFTFGHYRIDSWLFQVIQLSQLMIFSKPEVKKLRTGSFLMLGK